MGDDERWMRRALELARTAAAHGEVPVGAVVVGDGAALGEGYNAPIRRCDPTAHAEILALRAAALQTGNYRLLRSTLYVTVEPCLMCVGALLHARVDRVVYGCTEPKTGALVSVLALAIDDRFGRKLDITGGICADDARLLVQDFFRARRGA